MGAYLHDDEGGWQAFESPVDDRDGMPSGDAHDAHQWT
jgi:hypothetical protein